MCTCAQHFSLCPSGNNAYDEVKVHLSFFFQFVLRIDLVRLNASYFLKFSQGVSRSVNNPGLGERQMLCYKHPPIPIAPAQ